MEEVPLRRVGRYDLLEVIGRGGAAVVYLARQSDLQRYVALKELAPFRAADETFAQRFVEEGRLAGAMNHANIVTVHEFFETAGVPYIAMEYLPYGSLRQHIDGLSLAQIAGVLEGVLAGLSQGGFHGVVHRDLKPENLLVSVDGRVKIADFGVARALNNARTRAVVTVSGTTIGTPAYMAPEQALGEDLTPACDLYSLGVIAWEMFAGAPPFAQTDTPVAVLYRQVHEEVPPVRSANPEVDERIEQWIARMLAKDPADRFPTADDAWFALEDAVLELLGPRWRRDARLAVGDTPTVERAPLAPARFTDTDLTTPDPADADPVPRLPMRDTEDPVPVIPQTVGGMETVAPTSRPRPSYTTILRPARRHRDAGGDEAQPRASPWRRRSAIVGILVAMAGAAAAGVLLAAPSGPSSPTAAQQRQAQQAVARSQASALRSERATVVANGNDAVVKLMTGFGGRRSRAVTRLQNATTPSRQISGARTVQRDYTRVARGVARYERQTPKAGALARRLRSVASAYGRLATATQQQSSSGFNAARMAITADERALQKQLDTL
ncbi:MAG TPA: serine/threonine-protein kinase [Solirubrobacteraceae bacterium]